MSDKQKLHVNSNSKIKLKTSLTAVQNTKFESGMKKVLKALFLVQFVKCASSY